MNHQLKIFNSLTGEKEVFVPLHENNVGMYVCGPTVYSNVHLGNVRTFMSFDFVYRTLKFLGYKVRYVRNITDAGHLTDDGDVNNDRFVKQSRLEKLEPMEIVQKYTVDFHKVLQDAEGHRLICWARGDLRGAHLGGRRHDKRVRETQQLLAVKLLRPRRREYFVRQEAVDKGHPRRREPADAGDLHGRRAACEHHERHAALGMPAEVDEHVDLIRTDALRLFFDGDVLDRRIADVGAQGLRECIRTVAEGIGVNIVFFPQTAHQPRVEKRGGRVEEMRRDETDAQTLMPDVFTRRERFLMTVERRVHVELRLEFLRREVRHMAEVEVVGEVLALTPQKFILRRRFKIRRECALRIGKRTAARAHHLGEAPLFLVGDLVVAAHVQDRFNRLIDVSRVNILANRAVVLHPTHCSFFLSSLKNAISGGHPMRRGNQLPLPTCT